MGERKQEELAEAMRKQNWRFIADALDSFYNACQQMTSDHVVWDVRCRLSKDMQSCCEFRKCEVALVKILKELPRELEEEHDAITELLNKGRELYGYVTEEEEFDGQANYEFREFDEIYSYLFYFERYALLQGLAAEKGNEEDENPCFS